uniref:Reverse transcriptase domain-containing protein n=1 Tax=Fagus sylvatica TaxID=28930 RepID=A0A2N9FDC7_FAGSY
MEIKGFGGVGEYTKGHIQLVLKVGPIVALTRFHVVDSVVPYHILLGRPWLHKHQLIPSTYHQCVKGRLNGKPIRIAANSTPFDQSESHFVEAALYDEITSDAPEADLRDLLERKKKRKVEASASKSQPQCVHIPESADTAEAVTADPKISAKEELEVINLSSDPNVHRPISISASLSVEERMHLVELLKEYQDVFAWQYDEMPGIDPKLVAHSLNVEPGTRPVHPRWLSNIVPMKKKNGQIRCCVDFRNLNKACPKDEFPLPNMDLLIDSAAGHAMFSFMDGFSGYNQILMSPRDAEKTAFRTPIGNFYYTVMPFGLKNAGATYQRTMTAMFHDMMHREIEDYVDDIVVKSKTREDHFGILKKVFERCPTVQTQDESSQMCIWSFSWQISGFLRCTNVLVTSAFAPLLKKGAPFHWSTANAKQAFEKVQDIMTKLPTVCAPIFGKPLRLYLASNSQAIGALIAQENDNGVEQPIYYVSRTLKDAESRYSGAERSCLALIYASQRLRHYFLAHKVQLMTKSHPIRSLLQRPVLSGRLAQWLLQLSQYEIIAETSTAIKSQAIAHLLAQFLGEDNSFISDEVPGEINEVFLAGLADSVWTLKFDGSSTATSAGAGIVLYKDDGEAVTKSFKFDFPCSNNAAEYEAYLAGLAIAYEMGIKHLRVIRRLQPCAKFNTFEIEHAQRNENRYADALATLGSQIVFESEEMECHHLQKDREPITESLKKEFEELASDQEDWPYQSGLRWSHLDPCSHRVFYKMGRSHPPPKGNRCCSRKFHSRAHNHSFWHTIQARYRQWYSIHKQGCARSARTLPSQASTFHTLLPSRCPYGHTEVHPRTATGFTPFSLVYGTDTVSPTKLVVPSPRVMQGSELEVDANICAEARMEDLEGLDEARDLAKAKSQRNYQKMANVYSKALRVRIFVEGQMVLKVAEFVRRNLPSPSKFSPNWDGPYIIREAHGSGYYRLSKSDGTALAYPITHRMHSSKSALCIFLLLK